MLKFLPSVRVSLSMSEDLSRRLDGMKPATLLGWSVSTGVRLNVDDNELGPNTACHSRLNSSSSVDGALRISFNREMSSLSASLSSRLSVSGSFFPAKQWNKNCEDNFQFYNILTIHNMESIST